MVKTTFLKKNLIKSLYNKYSQWEMLKDFPLNQEKDMGSTINIHIWHFTENSSQFSKTRKKKIEEWENESSISSWGWGIT